MKTNQLPGVKCYIMFELGRASVKIPCPEGEPSKGDKPIFYGSENTSGVAEFNKVYVKDVKALKKALKV